MTDTITIGIIGCGYWGPNLLRNFISLPDCTVKTISDLNQNRLDHMKTLYQSIITTTDYRDIVNDPTIDAVAVATPVGTHHALTKECLEAGKHVFIEKPMASSVAQCNDLIETASQKHLRIMVGHTFIYSSPVRKIKEILDSGEIGDLLYINTRRLNLGLFQKDINVTWDLAPHDISIILYLLGEPPFAVNCNGRAHVNHGIEDITTLVLNFSNGKFATIDSSWLDPYKVREMKFVGSKKMIVYDDTEPLEKIKVYDKRVEVPPHYDTFAEFQYSYHYGDMYSPYIHQIEPLKTETRQFVDYITNGAECPSSGLDGMRVVQILEASSESLKKEGSRIDITH